MKFAIVAEVAVIALAGVLTLSSAASAQPSNRECWAMADRVKAALSEHPDASATARDHYRVGTEACTRGLTRFGVAQFEAAMKALGG
jgi:hypothetical protein